VETILFALAMVLVAGFINGSFAAPMKYMTRWGEENIWLIFSFWGFLILPWITILVMAPHFTDVLRALPSNLFWTMVLGGVAFGIGQIAFALSFRYIGIGLAFVINISMGTSGSALIPILWHKGIMGTPYSYAQMLGIVVFVLAVVLGAAAGAARDRMKRQSRGGPAESKVNEIKPGRLILGVVLAIVAGVGSVAQGVTYIWANPTVSKVASDQFGVGDLASGVVAWVVIFSAAWLPYFLYFFVLNLKRRSFGKLASAHTGPYWFWLPLMGVGYWGSLVFFSKASEAIGGDLAPTIAWPLFMVFIILTSNLWSYKSHEWDGAGKKAIRRMWASLGLFICAIVVFSYSSKLEPPDPSKPEAARHTVHYMHIKHSAYPTHEMTGDTETEQEYEEEGESADD